MKIKRYLVFCGQCYYASGGWVDFKSSFNSLSRACTYLVKQNKEWDSMVWGHIVDTKTGRIVFEIEDGEQEFVNSDPTIIPPISGESEQTKKI